MDRILLTEHWTRFGGVILDKCPQCGYNDGDDVKKPERKPRKPLPADFQDKAEMMMRGELPDNFKDMLGKVIKYSSQGWTDGQERWFDQVYKGIFGDQKPKAASPEKKSSDPEWDQTLLNTF